MNTAHHYHMQVRGLGAVSPVTASAGGTLLAAAPLTGPAAPIVATAGAITELLASIGIGAGCGQTCITASDYANQAEVLLQQNLAAYMALPTPRSPAAQAQAVANFNSIWNGLVEACAGVSGTAGANCIGDRQEGACHFHDSSGNCWNWFTGYLNPIENDPNVASAGATVAPATTSTPGTTQAAAASVQLNSTANILAGLAQSPLFLIGGGIILLALLSEAI